MTETIHASFVEIARDLSPVLKQALEEIGPVQLVPSREFTLPERLCRAVAGQQLSVKAALTIWGRVCDSAGEKPLVEHLMVSQTDSLRGCGLSASKAKAMIAIAEAARAGQLDAEELGALNHAERAKRLTAIWGVGQWTADMIGIGYFGDPDVWPEGDITARKTLERLTSTRRKTIRTAARFAPHRSYLAIYMWRLADAVPE